MGAAYRFDMRGCAAFLPLPRALPTTPSAWVVSRQMDGHDDTGWLGHRGGWVLLGLGAALIALAVLTSSHEALAAIFAFTGIATAILGVLLPRLEGPFEISVTKLAATIKAARKIGVSEDLTFDDRANAIFKLLGITGSASPTEKPKVASKAEDRPTPPTSAEPTAPPFPSPLSFIVTGEVDRSHAVGMAFERHVQHAFDRAGWETEAAGPGVDYGVDFVARNDSRVAFVTVLMRRRLSAADVDRAIGTFRRIDPSEESLHVLAVNEGAFSARSREALATASNLHVLEFPVEGW